MPSDAKTPLLTSQIKPDPDGPFPIDIPFVRHLGLTLLEFGDGKALVGLNQQAHHLNTFGMAHGGVVMTMMDICMLMAGRAAARDDDDPAKSLITIELKTSFMQPAVGAVRAAGTCMHRTATMAFCEGELLDENNVVRARASGTFKYMKLRK